MYVYVNKQHKICGRHPGAPGFPYGSAGDRLGRRFPGIALLPCFAIVISLALLTPLLGLPACSPAQNSGPERDAWQRPAEVMDELGIRAGSVVADVGCGRGYFTVRLAERVGPQGKVYAEDIDNDVLDAVRREVKKSGFAQVETIVGKPDDPGLPPASVDVVLAMNTYHEWRKYDAMLQGLYRALKPGGLLPDRRPS